MSAIEGFTLAVPNAMLSPRLIGIKTGCESARESLRRRSTKSGAEILMESFFNR